MKERKLMRKDRNAYATLNTQNSVRQQERYKARNK